MSAESRIFARLESLGRSEEKVLAELDELRARKLIACDRCGRRTRVSRLVYLQTHWYVTPHGCTGGDYWRPGEGQFDCPKCGARNRLYDRPDVVALKPYFAATEDVYDK